MIQETFTYHYRKCGSTNIAKNGTNKCSNDQNHCKDCGAYGMPQPCNQIPDEQKTMILRAYKERASRRGLERIFGAARQTVMRWLQETVPALLDLKDTLLPAQPDDDLELSDRPA